MVDKAFSNIRETSTTGGTGNQVLAGAFDASYRTWSSKYADTQKGFAMFKQGSSRELSEITYNAGANSLSRSVIWSTNANALVNFTAGQTIDISDVLPGPSDLSSAQLARLINLLGGLAITSNLSDLASAATAFANIKQAATASATGVVKRQRFAVVWDQKAQNTEGGTLSANTSTTRTLNTKTDLDSIVTLSSNQITLPAGTYRIRWSAPAYKVDQHQSSLYNVTSTTTLGRGQSSFAFNTDEAQSFSAGVWIGTLAASQALEIRHIGTSTRANNGQGLPTNKDVEIYTVVEIESYDQ